MANNNSVANPLRVVLSSSFVGGNNRTDIINNETSVAAACMDISVLMTQMNDWTHYLLVRVITFSAYILLFILGMIGNVGIIVSIVSSGEVKVVANVFLLNLALIDVLICLIAIPITPVTSVFKLWYFGDFLCKFVPMCQGMTVLVTSISLVFIAIDRHRNIVQLTSNPWTFKHALCITFCGWVFAGVLNIPVYRSQELSTLPQSEHPVCGIFCIPQNWEVGTKKSYGTAMFSLQFLAPLVILALCYTRILCKVRQDMIVGAVAGATQQSQAARRKTRVMIVLITMVTAFFLCWLPMSILNILRDYDVSLGKTLFTQLFFFSNLVHFLAMSSVVWNPLLYFWMSKYRRRGDKIRRTMSTMNSFNTNNGGMGGTLHSTCGGGGAGGRGGGKSSQHLQGSPSMAARGGMKNSRSSTAAYGGFLTPPTSSATARSQQQQHLLQHRLPHSSGSFGNRRTFTHNNSRTNINCGGSRSPAGTAAPVGLPSRATQATSMHGGLASNSLIRTQSHQVVTDGRPDLFDRSRDLISSLKSSADVLAAKSKSPKEEEKNIKLKGPKEEMEKMMKNHNAKLVKRTTPGFVEKQSFSTSSCSNKFDDPTTGKTIEEAADEPTRLKTLASSSDQTTNHQLSSPKLITTLSPRSNSDSIHQKSASRTASPKNSNPNRQHNYLASSSSSSSSHHEPLINSISMPNNQHHLPHPRYPLSYSPSIMDSSFTPPTPRQSLVEAVAAADRFLPPGAADGGQTIFINKRNSIVKSLHPKTLICGNNGKNGNGSGNNKNNSNHL